jgi:hypothetical protein
MPWIRIEFYLNQAPRIEFYHNPAPRINFYHKFCRAMSFKTTFESSVYGKVVVEEDDIRAFHKAVHGLIQIEEVADEFAEKGGVDYEKMYPAHVKMRAENAGAEHVTYFQISEHGSRKTMSFGLTEDPDRFPFFPREDGYWAPESERDRRPPSSQAPPTSTRNTSRRNTSTKSASTGPNRSRNGSKGAEKSNGQAGPDPARRVVAERDSSPVVDAIDRIENAPDGWLGNTISDEHARALWSHLKHVRGGSGAAKESELRHLCSTIGVESLSDASYQQAQTVLSMIEDPMAQS